MVGGEAERLDIASRLCDEFLERVDIAFSQYSGHRTPPSSARCMVEILDPRSAARVYDPICGSGELLAAAGHNLSRRGDAEPIVFGQANHPPSTPATRGRSTP